MARAALGDRARPKARRNQLAAENSAHVVRTLSKPAAGRSELPSFQIDKGLIFVTFPENGH
jgi:hypothetical protein